MAALKLLVVIVDYQVPGLVIQLLESLAGLLPELPAVRVVVVENSGAGAAQQLEESIASAGWQGWVTVLMPAALLRDAQLSSQSLAFSSWM